MLNKIIGCITFAVAILPVVISKVISIGTRLFIKPTRFCIVVRVKSIIPAKFDIISVTISKYCT